MKKITEQDSLYNNLDNMSTLDILKNINQEDEKIAQAVKKSIPTIKELVDISVKKISSGGRLFYIGSGTSGRLGILDASECPPTFGVNNNLIIGLIAGGDIAIKTSIEHAEDDYNQAWIDLTKYNINKKDVVLGISASGTTPYVIGGLNQCQKNNIYTGSITCNQEVIISQHSDICIPIIVGPEFLTGSTRMKSGTAQKMVLNMISTGIMIKLGHVIDNKMIDMKIKNNKLEERGINIIMDILKISQDQARLLINKHGSVRSAINSINNNV